MESIFCGHYINIDRDFKQVKRDIYNAILAFHDFKDRNDYENWKNHLKQFTRYFSLSL